MVQEKANVVVLLMNDRGYGVIRNIQDAQYGGRRYYADLHTPDFERLAQSIALPLHRVRDLGQIGSTLRDALAQPGPAVIEIDMTAIGPFAQAFSGPPVKKEAA
jgi:acetolactate synthase-1/2/3 large subunit